jgi:hypothetical protein
VSGHLYLHSQSHPLSLSLSCYFRLGFWRLSPMVVFLVFLVFFFFVQPLREASGLGFLLFCVRFLAFRAITVISWGMLLLEKPMGTWNSKYYSVFPWKWTMLFRIW